MSTHSQRIISMQTLIAGSILSSSSSVGKIIKEFNEVTQASKIRRTDRKQLLQVLHSTRALDTSLKELIKLHGIKVKAQALGSYLYGFTNHTITGLAKLPANRRDHYQKKIVDIRNRYLHTSGAYPANNTEIQNLLSEMHNCLIDILNL